ncbi:hypothetical protein N0V93_004472 [Gnomoniopsis smithogilvyi]|uniref:Major facilitator superfamily (MFS) profile domain-containing protein n=1 Tax=Gnomoniopsis smithogilvyi TaxID=1191159 RepID=A0A9W9CW83_9PEZI|nr:hypothetical protein N0V93_004472 [Gnomoniopsis smithogilvyi]
MPGETLDLERTSKAASSRTTPLADDQKGEPTSADPGLKMENEGSPTAADDLKEPQGILVDRYEASRPDQEPPSEQLVVSASSDGDPAQAVEAPYSSFSLFEKRMIVLAASLSAFFSPLTAQIYFPALNVVAEAFDVSISKINLTVTTYMIFQGITPMFIGGFADTAGRRPAYVICFVVYIAANIGVALCQNYAELLVLRCIQSAGSSSTVALCQAVVADTVTSSERGQYVGITVLPIVLAPSLGPVLGGILAQYLGWRSIFWFLTIIAVITLVAMLLFFPETCRSLVGDGSIRPHPIYRTVWQMIKDSRKKRKAKRSGDADLLHRVTTTTSSKSPPKFTIKFGNPFDSVMLLFEPVLGLLLLYSGIVFAGFYAIATSMSENLKDLYDLTEIELGLMYLPMAAGSVAAAFIVGPGINWNYRRHAKRLGMTITKGRQDDLSNFPIEKARIEVGLPLLLLATLVLFAWGWALQYKTSIAVPAVLLFLMGLGMIGFSNTSSVLIVDMYPGRAGAATAANNLTRCLIGSAATAAITPMINGMGIGWAFTVYGFLYLIGAPMLLLIMRNGIKWRRQLREKEERKKARREEKQPEGAAEKTDTTESLALGSTGVDEKARAGEDAVSVEGNDAHK